MDRNIAEFCDALASASPTPGGGGAAALTGALAAALGGMVGSLTEGKPKYAEVEADIRELDINARRLRLELLELIELDARAFLALKEAYSLPKGAPDRAEMVEKALKSACEPPLRIMRLCCELTALCEGYAKKGSRLAVSDAGCAAALCAAALESAALNVFVNTKSMADRTAAEKINAEAGTMLEAFVPRARAVYAEVRGGLCNG